jgi:hypothetical protein
MQKLIDWAEQENDEDIRRIKSDLFYIIVRRFIWLLKTDGLAIMNHRLINWCDAFGKMNFTRFDRR